MATSLNARFDADFSALQKAVAGAEVHFQTFEKSAGRASSEVGKLASSFRGDKLIADALQASKAVEAIGGASKLATTDAQKLQTQVSGAMDALKRQGADVPAGLQRISAELKAINEVGHVEKAIGGLKDLGGQAGPAGAAIEGLAGKFTGLGSSASILGPLGIAIAGVAAGAVALVAIGGAAVSSLIGMVEHAADAGDQMLTLSNKTKIGVDALSTFKYVGEQTGTSLEGITDAVFKMSVNLGKGSEESQKAIKALGLSFTDLKNARPEDAFIQTIEALSKIGNTAQQQAVGVALFGKGFKEVSQLTREDIGSLIQRFKDLGGGVTTEMAIAGDAVNDALGDISTAFESVKLKIGAAFLPTVAAVLQKFADAWIIATRDAGVAYVGFAQTLDQVAAEIVQIIGATVLAISDLAKSTIGAGENLISFGKTLQYIIPDFGQSGKTFIEAGKNLQSFGESGKGVTSILDKLGGTLLTTTAGSLTKIRDQIMSAAEAARNSQQSFSGLGDSLDPPKDKIKSLGEQMAKTIEQARKTAIEFDTGKLKIGELGAKQAEVNKLFLDAAQNMQAMGTASGPLYDKFTKLAFATANWNTTLGPLKLGLEDVIKELPKLADNLTQTDITIGAYARNLNTLPDIAKAFGLKNVPKDLKDADDAFQSSFKKTNDAFHFFGLTSRQELQGAAVAAQQNYQILAASGAATAAQLTTAYNAMIDAQIKSTGKLPPLWHEIAPEIKGVLFDVRDSFNEAVAGMLLHITSLRDGWAAIWDSMKQSALKILEDILSYYEKVFIAKLIGNLTGVNIPIGGVGGGGGGGGIGSSVAGTAVQQGESAAGKWALNALGLGGTTAATSSTAFGLGTAAAGEIGITTTAEAGLGAGASTIGGLGAGGAAAGSGTGAGAGAAGAGGTFGGAGATLLGAGAIGGAGLGLGLLGTKIFGGAGWKAAGFGAATGAGAGALIGTLVFPGIGTAVGAGIGAVAGLIGGWIGKSVGEKLNDARDEFTSQFGGTGTGAGSGFAVLASASAELESLGLHGKKLFDDVFKADNFDDFNAAVSRMVNALGSVPYVNLKVQQSFDALQQSQQQLTDSGMATSDVLVKQAGDYSALFDTIVKSGASVPAGLEPILQTLIDMGLLVDENGDKVTNLDKLIRVTADGSVGGLEDVNGALTDLIKGLDDTTKRALLNSQAWQDVLFNGKKIGPDISASLIEAAKSAGLTQDQIDAISTALGDVSDAAQQASDALENMPRSVDVDIRYRRDVYDNYPDAPPTATGGIVTRPQVRLVGEAGPEAIIPLNQMRGSGQKVEIHVHTNLDGREVAYTVVPYVPEVLGLHGLAT